MEKDEDKNFAGKNGFIWWFGVVEDRQDPLRLGRCRVRCVGWHADDKMRLPTQDLPWAMPSLPTNNTNPYAPREGDMVFGFFVDGENAQEPVILGVLPGIPLAAANRQQAFNDPRTQAQIDAAPVKPNESKVGYPRNLDEPTTSRLARNETIDNSIVSRKKAKKANRVEPDPYYNATYPYNNVYESESGHVLEFDDTPNNERVHLYHRAGSYIEMGPNGDRSERIERNKFTVVIGDEEVYVKGDVKIYVDGNVNMDVNGNYSAQIGGTCTFSSDGRMRFTAPRIDFN